MKLFTLQSQEKIEEIKKTGILKSGNKIMDDYFLDSYAWLEGEMHKRLPKPDIKCEHPIWAWYKYGGKRKPDMRSYSRQKGEVIYRIEFEIEDNKVLLSDFSDWHYVLNTSDENDIKSFRTTLDNEFGLELEKGWVLSDDKLIYNWDNIFVNSDSDIDYIQATLWYIRNEQIIKIEKFN